MVIVDTGFWVALANIRDKYHGLAKSRLIELSNQGETFITTWPVMTETCHLLLRDMGTTAQAKFIENYHKGAFEIFDLSRGQAQRISVLLEKYADLPMDLADASLVILAEHLGHGCILSVDQRDFHAYRWKQHHPFENVLLS